MAAQPIGGRSVPVSNWYPDSSTYSHSYLMAGMRAGLIALVLLAIFIGIAVF